MTCNNCKIEEERQKQASEFMEALQDFISFYQKKGIHPEDISTVLIAMAKVEGSKCIPCYHHMLGILTDALTENIFEIWCEIQEQISDKKGVC